MAPVRHLPKSDGLRYDGYANGPPPTYHMRMLQRHALVYATNLVYSWKSAQRRILNIIQGKGHLAGEGMLDRHDWNGPEHWLADHPDQYHVSKPIVQYVSADNAIRAPLPPPTVAAIPAARNATGNPW